MEHYAIATVARVIQGPDDAIQVIVMNGEHAETMLKLDPGKPPPLRDPILIAFTPGEEFARACDMDRVVEAPRRFIIEGEGKDDETGDPLFWSNAEGWTERAGAFPFFPDDPVDQDMNMPVGAVALHYVGGQMQTIRRQILERD